MADSKEESIDEVHFPHSDLNDFAEEVGDEEVAFETRPVCFNNMRTDVEILAWRIGNGSWQPINPPMRQTCNYPRAQSEQCGRDGKYTKVTDVQCDVTFDITARLRQIGTGRVRDATIAGASASCRNARLVCSLLPDA